MEIACRKCGARLTVNAGAAPIVRCTNCQYPNPVAVPPSPVPPGPVPTPVPPTPVPPPLPPKPTPVPIPVAKPVPQPVHNPVPQPIPAPVPPPAPRATASSELGWLVVHDEYADHQTHPLRIGRQVIGRKSVSRPCDIMIETDDPYMGRNHCILEVKPSRSGGYEYFLSDVKMTSGVPEQMSTNGTFVNSQPSPLRPKDMVYLKDGDVIQMGKTKAVIKTLITVASARDASRVVQDMDYAPTVIIQ